MDEKVIALLQQIVDAIGSLETTLEQQVSWLGERIEEVRSAEIATREKIDTEGSYVQDRLNEIKAILGDLPRDIADCTN